MMKTEVKEALLEGRSLVFVDEAIFITPSRITHAYAQKNTNCFIDELKTNVKSLAVVAGVSRDLGVDGFLIHQRSINSQNFIQFLEQLMESTIGAKLALFADNCTVHHSKVVKKFTEDHDIKMIYNLPYSPQYNPIEIVWSLVKNKYKREKLDLLLQGRKIKHEILVRKCLLETHQDTVATICTKALKKYFDVDV